MFFNAAVRPVEPAIRCDCKISKQVTSKSADKADNGHSWVNVCFDVDRDFLKRRCMIVVLRPRHQRKALRRCSARI